MVNNMVFRWPKPLFFMVLGAHGSLIFISMVGSRQAIQWRLIVSQVDLKIAKTIKCFRVGPKASLPQSKPRNKQN